MLGKMTPYGNVPFFWTRHYNKTIQYVGNARSWDSIHIEGSPRKNDFLALYIKDNKVLAATGQGRSSDVLTIMEALQQNELPPADQLIANPDAFKALRQKLSLTKGGGCKRANCCQKKSVVQ